MREKIVWLPAICLMLLIFWFSSQPAAESADLSGGISYRVIYTVSVLTGQSWSEEEKLHLAEQIDHPIRKTAHLTEYAMLGMAAALGIAFGSEWGRKVIWKQYFAVQIIGSLYAASDEFHQLFVPGRAGMLTDVLIDSLGVLLGWIIFAGGKKLVLAMQHKK